MEASHLNLTKGWGIASKGQGVVPTGQGVASKGQGVASKARPYHQSPNIDPGYNGNGGEGIGGSGGTGRDRGQHLATWVYNAEESSPKITLKARPGRSRTSAREESGLATESSATSHTNRDFCMEPAGVLGGPQTPRSRLELGA